MEHSYENYELVLDLVALPLDMTSFHGFSRHICNGLGGCY